MHFSSYVAIVPVLVALVESVPTFNIPTIVSNSRTSCPSGALYVAKSGGKYKTIQAAVDALNADSTTDQAIFIAPGTYNEQVTIPKLKGKLNVYGHSEDTTSYQKNTVTIANSYSRDQGASSDEYTATLRAGCTSCSFFNLNVENNYASTASGSQSLALSSLEDAQGYYGMSFKSKQKAIYANQGHQAFGKCKIEAASDYIYGFGKTWVSNTDIRVIAESLKPKVTVNTDSYIVHDKCNIAPAASYAGVNQPSVGRPWGVNSKIVFQNTVLKDCTNIGAAIVNIGTGIVNMLTTFFGALASKAVTIDQVLGGSYKSWVQTSYCS